MKLDNIIKNLCQYMNENIEKLDDCEWAKLYSAKELIKQVNKDNK